MAITLRLPVIVDLGVLREGLQIAAKCGTELKIETYFRVRNNHQYAIDCDTEAEVRATAAALDTPPADPASLEDPPR